MQIRLNININTQSAGYIETVSERRAVSKTEAVRQLIGVGGYILNALAEGKTIYLEDQHGHQDRVVMCGL